MRKAFTLIELLVVIAIIAILAAILFPVFAQAKAAAKKAAGTSNAKQLTLGVLMYENDVDDTVPPATAWAGRGNGYPLCFGGTECFAQWTYLCVPYIKNSGVFYDPQAPNTPDTTYPGNTIITATSWPNFGYNYVYLSPWNGTQQKPIQATSPDAPAQTIMLAEKSAASEFQYGQPYFWGFSFTIAADGPLLSSTIEAPNCGPIPQYCASNWGTGSFCNTCSTYEAGNTTGGMAVRAGGQSIVSFLDGHVKAYAASALAVGTNYSKTLPNGSLTWTSAYPASYLWSTQKTWTVQGSY